MTTETASIKGTAIYAKACFELQAYLKKHYTLESAWNACTNIDWMVWALHAAGIAHDEKRLRLFACWCCRETPLADGRKVWDLLTDERSRNAVEVAERYANGEATAGELDVARAVARDAAFAVARDASTAVARAASLAATWDDAWAAARDASLAAAWEADWDAARDAQATQFRAMFPCPFVGNEAANPDAFETPDVPASEPEGEDHGDN